MKRMIICFILLALAGLCLAVTHYVRQPIQMTDDGGSEYYDRGMDITFGNGYYWMVYGKCTDSVFEGTTNEEFLVPDGAGGYRTFNDYNDFGAMITPCGAQVHYEIYYKKAVSIPALANAQENQILIGGVAPIANVNMGEVYCEFYDNKIFVFTTQGGGTEDPDDYNQLYYTLDGSSWVSVGKIFDHETSGRFDFTVYQGDLWAVNGEASVVHLSNPTSLTAWETAIEDSILIADSLATAPVRFFIDPYPEDGVELYLVASTTGGINIIYKYSGGAFSEFQKLDIQGNYPVLNYDPLNEKYFYIVSSESFYVHDGFQGTGLFQAHAYFMYWAVDNMSTFQDTSSAYAERWKILDPAQYPNVDFLNNPWDVNTWVEYNSQIYVDDQGATPSGKTYFFFSSERIADNPLTDQQSGDIYCIPFDWGDLTTNHFNFISTAFDSLFVRRYKPDIHATLLTGCTTIVYTVHEDYYTFPGVAEGDTLELMSGVYDENVTVNANAIIDGNKVAEIHAANRGYSFEIVADTSCTIVDCKIMDGIWNKGSGTVTATHNYWGEDGPTASEIYNISGGTVNYIPWYADEAMTTPVYPSPDADISFNGSTATITWTVDYPGATYKVYGSNDPIALGTDLGVQDSGYTNSDYQFYAVTAIVNLTEYANEVGKAGYFTHALQTGYNFIPISLEYGYDNVMDMSVDLGNPSYDYSLSVWNTSSQGWISATKTNLGWEPAVGIDIEVGDIVLFNSGTYTPSTIYLSGPVPDNWANFALTTTVTTDMNLIYLPLNKASLTDLGSLGESLGNTNCNLISIWDATNQGWISGSYLSTWDFWTHTAQGVAIGEAVMVGALQNFTWPQ